MFCSMFEAIIEVVTGQERGTACGFDRHEHSGEACIYVRLATNAVDEPVRDRITGHPYQAPSPDRLARRMHLCHRWPRSLAWLRPPYILATAKLTNKVSIRMGRLVGSAAGVKGRHTECSRSKSVAASFAPRSSRMKSIGEHLYSC